MSVRDWNYYTYVNGPETRTMEGRHALIKSRNRITSGHLAVLLVHVVRARAGVVANPDTEVLDLLRLLLGDLQRFIR